MNSALVAIAIWALAPAQTVGESVDDARITARIETMFLMNDHLSPFNINTTTSGGEVTLSGSVSDQIQRDLAADLAESVEGVRSVNNQITIVEAYAPPAPPRNWRQKINDMNTAASIKRRLVSQGELRGLKIGVNVERAAVTLFGVVGTEAQRDHIAQIAMDTEGIARVENNLTVRAKEQLDQVQNVGRQVGDEWTEKRVETALAFNSHIQVRDLNVEVDDGICILTGLVDTAAQRDLASSIAEHIYSVGEVRNEIRVREGAETAPPPPPPTAAPPAHESPSEPPLEFLEAE